MPSKRAAKWFGDIASAAERALEWSAKGGGPDLALRDDILRSAIERQLLIISEAAIRLNRHDQGLAETLAPDVDWPNVRGIGNVLRHRYDDLDFETIASALKQDLTPLRAACLHAISALNP